MPFPLSLGGPEIPEALLEALETERLVLFCGAGVSKYPASGLPLFGELVSHVYDVIGEVRSPAEVRTEKANQLDKTLALLDQRIRNGRVREVACARIAQSPAEPAKLHLHADLLSLSKCASGHRLVTTNYDRRFEEAAPLIGVSPPQRHGCSALPVPRPDRWGSIVHLHGHVEDRASMVLTSADFGRAYLTERWASRFITELFRHFTVLFVGYSVADPVVAYLVDALAAERASGMGFKEAYSLADYGRGQGRVATEGAWRDKGITPILYSRKGGYRALGETVHALAEHHADGIASRRSYAMRAAAGVPDGPNDPVAQRVIWALSEPTGSVARAFVGAAATVPQWLTQVIAPPAPSGWSARAAQSDPESAPSASLGLVRGAALSLLNPRVAWEETPNPELCGALAGLVLRHLDELDVLDWVVGHGRALSERMRLWVRERLLKNTKLRPDMRRSWELLSSEFYSARVQQRRAPVYSLPVDRLGGGIDPVALHDLLARLAPVPQLSVRDQLDSSSPTLRRRAPDLAIQLVAGPNTSVVLDRLCAIPGARAASLHTIEGYVHEVLGLINFLHPESDDSGRTELSTFERPSISQHSQNTDRLGWGVLIDLLRDGLGELVESDTRAARALVERWHVSAALVFKRLALHAVTAHDALPASTGVSLLLADESRLLWSAETMRETAQFLRKAAGRVSAADAARLVAALSLGPPQESYDGIPTRYAPWKAREQDWWVRLQAARTGHLPMPDGLLERAKDIETRLNLRVRDDDRQEFSRWTSFSFGPADPEPRIDLAALAEDGALGVLTGDKMPRPDGALAGLTEFARSTPNGAVKLLRDCINAGAVKPDVWSAAYEGFYGLEGEALTPGLRDGLTALLTEVGTAADESDSALFWTSLWFVRAWEGADAEDAGDEFWRAFDLLWRQAMQHSVHKAEALDVDTAINHPVGRLTEALFDRLWAKKLHEAAGLPERERVYLQACIDTDSPQALLARIIIASRLAGAHFLDPQWTEEHVLPRMDWAHSDEARALWQGYLWTVRSSLGLLAAMKVAIVSALPHLNELGESGRNLCILFAEASISHQEILGPKVTRLALKPLQSKHLAAIARGAEHVLEWAGDDAAQLWRNRLGPWFHDVWPKDHDRKSSQIAEVLARIVLGCGDAAEDAFTDLHPLIVPMTDDGPPSFILRAEELAEAPPTILTGLLLRLVPEQRFWWTRHVTELLPSLDARWPVEASRAPLDELRRRVTFS